MKPWGIPGSTVRGGAIRNTPGAILTVTDCLLTDNQAIADIAGTAVGGAIYNEGSTLTVSHSTFIGNQIIAGNGSGAGIQNIRGSTATVSDSTFVGNQVIARDGRGGTGFARGAGIYNNTATLRVENSTFLGNRALGGSNNTGDSGVLGFGAGGAIMNADRATLFVSGSTFTGNQALGGSNNVSTSTSTGDIVSPGSSYGGGLYTVGVATVTDSTFEDNEARGGSGNRGGAASFQNIGTAAGGAIAIEATNSSSTPVSLVLSDVTLRHNRAIGGDGNTAGTFTAATFLGTAWGGGLYCDDLGFGSTTTIRNSLITDNQAVGGQGVDGKHGADGLGGGVANVFGSALRVSGSTVSANQAVGGAGGAGGHGGQGLGGGLFNDGPSTAPINLGAPTILMVLDTRITHNEAEGGAGSTGGDGLGGGLYVADSRSDTVTVTVADSRIEHNEAEGGDGGGRHHRDDGQGIGGGVYIAGGTVCITNTKIKHNHADTSDDNVFGVFTTDC